MTVRGGTQGPEQGRQEIKKIFGFHGGEYIGPVRRGEKKNAVRARKTTPGRKKGPVKRIK